MFKAIELDPVSRQRTGREYGLAVETRQAAVDALLKLLGARLEDARIDPSRTLIQLTREPQLWTIVGAREPPAAGESPPLRRAGAPHRRVR